MRDNFRQGILTPKGYISWSFISSFILKLEKNHNLICEELKTKKLQYSVALIERINKVIDDLRADIVYTHWVHDVHQDHSAVGRATLNAARHVPRILMYRSNWYATNAHFNNKFFVDISPNIKTKN